MRVPRSSLRARAMSLIELLCVMAIIALLAALLLPALGQAKAQAKRAQCVDHLRQAGVGFVSFANDHSGQFPMAVPASAGGSLEFAQSGSHIEGDFYFSFRHFQAASSELVTPKLVVCPADTRLPAASFATLSNGNLSYFIGINARFAQPTSILAGDRNLTNDYTAPSTLVRLGDNYALRWTDELHRFKGNLLFSDGHVEEKNNIALRSAAGQVPAIANLALPTVRQPGTGTSSSPEALKGAVPAMQPATGKPPKPDFVWVPIGGGGIVMALSSSELEALSTNAVAAATPAKAEENDATLSAVAGSPATVTPGPTKKEQCWLYFLLLLVVAVAFVLRVLARGRNRPRA